MAQRTPLIVFGAAGRMGRMILECANPATQPFDLVAAVESPQSPAVGQPVTTLLASAPADLRITAELPKQTRPGTVAINFSHPEATLEQLAWARSTGTATVVGTTGLTEPQRAQVAKAAESVAVLFAPNMSVGVNVLYRLVAEAARLLGDAYDVEITEMHHRFKKDAPSGTAKALLESVLAGRGLKAGEAEVLHGREGLPGERKAGEIGMHAIRGGDVVGDHTVIFASLGERVELTHKATSRENFARGAVRAASWLSGRPAGLYSMKDVLGLQAP